MSSSEVWDLWSSQNGPTSPKWDKDQNGGQTHGRPKRAVPWPYRKIGLWPEACSPGNQPSTYSFCLGWHQTTIWGIQPRKLTNNPCSNWPRRTRTWFVTETVPGFSPYFHLRPHRYNSPDKDMGCPASRPLTVASLCQEALIRASLKAFLLALQSFPTPLLPLNLCRHASDSGWLPCSSKFWINPLYLLSCGWFSFISTAPLNSVKKPWIVQARSWAESGILGTPC